MSATVTTPRKEAPTVVDQAAGTRRPTATVLALARFEARELLLQIPVLVFFALYVGYTGWQLFSGREGMDDFPVLQDVDRATQTGPELVCIAVLICVNRAVLRSRKHGTEPLLGVLATEPWRRTVAHALSAVPFALATALVVALQFTWAALKPGAVGHGSPAELAVGPLAVLLSGALGVLIARLIPSSFGAPLFVIGVYAGTVFLSNAAGGAQWARRLAPVVRETGADPLPSDLLGRPAAWHALYLAGLTVLLAGIAVLLSGRRTHQPGRGYARPRGTRTVKAVTAVALAATIAGVAGQSTGAPAGLEAAREQASVTPEKAQSCVTHGTSTYCAFPEWIPRTADWAAAVDRVRNLAGGDAGGRPLTVRQRVEARYGLESDPTYDASGTPGEVTVGTRWGGNRIPEFAVGLASVLVTGDERTGAEVCDARVVTIMWLALAAEPDPMAAFRSVRIDDSDTGSAYVLTPTQGLHMTAEQTRIVRELLQRPRYSVTARVKAHWSQLTSGTTSTARVAELLDVPASPEGAAEDEEDGPCGE